MTGEYAQQAPGWVADQLAQIDAAGTTRAVDVQGRQVVVFTMRGARSGLLRRVPLMRVEHDGAYALVASKGGAPEHPVWYRNVTTHPEVEVQDGAAHHDAVVRELAGAERDEWWERAVEAFPAYAEYQVGTDRQIPVLLAEPVDGPSDAPDVAGRSTGAETRR